MNKLANLMIISGIAAVLVFFPTLASANLAPVWNPVYIKYGSVGRNIQFNVYAQDWENDRLSYYAMFLPIGAYFDRERRLFSWTPQEIGAYTAKFRVFDSFNSFSDMEIILEITSGSPNVSAVPNANNPPNYAYGGNVNSAGNGAENKPQIIIINTQPLNNRPAVSAAPAAQPAPAANPPADLTGEEAISDGDIDGEDENAAQDDRNNRLSLAATLIGIADNILLNPWLLIVLMIVLMVLLYRCAKKREALEQELALKRNHEAGIRN